MPKDPLDIQVWVSADWWRGGTSLGHQGHHPISVDIHTEFYSVCVQWQRETVTEDLHGPLHLNIDMSCQHLPYRFQGSRTLNIRSEGGL